MTKLLRSNIPSESRSKSVITFALTDIPCSTQPFYLQSRCDYLESKIPTWLNNYNQECFQKNNRPNTQ